MATRDRRRRRHVLTVPLGPAVELGRQLVRADADYEGAEVRVTEAGVEVWAFGAREAIEWYADPRYALAPEPSTAQPELASPRSIEDLPAEPE